MIGEVVVDGDGSDLVFFFFRQRTADEFYSGLWGSEIFIRDRATSFESTLLASLPLIFPSRHKTQNRRWKFVRGQQEAALVQADQAFPVAGFAIGQLQLDGWRAG